jgi:NTE family protein
MAPQVIDYLLLGGGAASATAAATLRLERDEGSILILSADDYPPYLRPALSKQLLLGASSDEQILLHPESFYREQNIGLVLGSAVSAVDPVKQLVTTTKDERYRYRHLLIATGVRPKRLALPNAGLSGVHYMRNINDCRQLRQKVDTGARRAVVLGASFLGMEIATSLIDLGLDVTIIERQNLVLPHIKSPEISDYFRRLAEGRGAVILLADSITGIQGVDKVSGVETESGERLPCDLLFVGIGAEPASDFLTGSGIARDTQGRVLVDDQLRTNIPGVFAAGDVTSFYDPVFARRRHIEHWDNAIKQGRLAARNMLGQRRRYDEVSYFFSDIADISFNMLGAPEEDDERIARGSLADGSFALFYLKDDVLRALFSAGRPVEETRSAEGLIRYRVNLRDAKSRLSDPGFPLQDIPSQTVLVLQGGGAMGAFEAGVVEALEEKQIFPDIVAGMSIGALNGAIIAGNPRCATKALGSFWSEISVATLPMFGDNLARAIASAQIVTFGVPNFFTPRWLQALSLPLLPMNWTSFYDVAPMKALITRYVDFSKLKASPVRLLVGAVNIESGELEIFDSYVDDLTPDHILASSSLPPGFPWTEIDDQAYWDGGIVSNSPLDIVIERCGPDGKRVFIVDLFAHRRARPDNLLEVMARRDEIVYSERVRSDLRLRELTGAYRRLIGGILDLVDPGIQAKIRQRPLYIQLMGDGVATSITRFVRQGQPGEHSSRDYDFSDIAIRANREQGYALARETLENASTKVAVPGDEAPRRFTPPGSLPSISQSDRLADILDPSEQQE